jgi:hypothetical protein
MFGCAVSRAAGKPALVRGLWRDHRHEPRVVRLVALIMLDYCVYDVNLWVAVITALAAFKRWRVLLSVFRSISAPQWACRIGNELLRSVKVVAAFEQVSALPTRIVVARLCCHGCAAQMLHQPLKELAAMPPDVREACMAVTAASVDADSGSIPTPASVAAVLHDVVALVQSCPVAEAVNLSQLVQVVTTQRPLLAGVAIPLCRAGVQVPWHACVAVRGTAGTVLAVA